VHLCGAHDARSASFIMAAWKLRPAPRRPH